MGLHHWHSPLSEEPQIGPQIGRNQCWGPWVSRISHWFWHMAQAHSLVAAMIQQSALSSFFLVVEPEFVLGSPEMDDLGVPLFQEPPLLVRATIALAIEFFLVASISHCFPCAFTKSQFRFVPSFFSSIRSHSMPILMVWSSPLYCLNSPMFAIILWSNRSNPPVFASARSPVNVVCRAQPSDRTKGGREMQEKGWRRGGHTWLTKNPMENGGPFWFWMGLNQAKWWNMLVSPWNMEVSYGWNNGSCVIVPLSSILWKKNTTQTKQTSTKTEVNVREKEGETVDWGIETADHRQQIIRTSYVLGLEASLRRSDFNLLKPRILQLSVSKNLRICGKPNAIKPTITGDDLYKPSKCWFFGMLAIIHQSLCIIPPFSCYSPIISHYSSHDRPMIVPLFNNY